MKAIYGEKLGMSRVFTSEGLSVPVTVLKVTPNVIHQVKTVETDGYEAVQVGIGEQKPQRLTKALARHYAKAKKGTPKATAEIRLTPRHGVEAGAAAPELGSEISVAGMFEAGEKVDVVGTSKGRGFAGVMKRHGMRGFIRTHGTHEYFRHGGSIGCRKFPGRVFKNKRMGGHMGVDRVIQLGLEVVAVRAEEHLLFVKGSVPGNRGSQVFVRKAIKG